jgi:hypothetical protein
VIFISFYRISNVNEKEISWDVLGYYMPLPATFIYDDPLLKNIDWLKKANDEKKLSGTLYMISSNDNGEPMYFFLFGMAMLYLPFFLLGYMSANLMGFPNDGFSPHYQYALVIGAIIYTIVGLIYFRKILRNYFSEEICSIVILTTVFSTNYIHHLSLKDLETVNVLFMLIAITIWYTIQWHKNPQLKYLIAIGSSITLMALVKPSEVIVLSIPLLWNVSSFESLREKIAQILKYKKQFYIVIGLSIIIASPQIIYWLIKTGKPLYDTYKNPGVGLDLFSPHIIDSLFSYRKGWLIYTPVMIFYLWGLFFTFKENKNIFFSIIVYFLTTFYIITSWTEWWYGAAFSNRPLIVSYPLLAIGFGYFLVQIQNRKTWLKVVFTLVLILFTFLNQFQWWQLKNYVLDTYRTTKDYYWATFLKTSATEEDKKLLLVYRDFEGVMTFNNKESYQSVFVKEELFENSETEVDTLNGNFFTITDETTYALTNKISYKELTKKDHLWAVISCRVRYPEGFDNTWPCLVVAMDRKGGNYGYFAPELKPDSIHSDWVTFKFEYLTPEIRNTNDQLKYYIWKRGEKGFDVDNFRIEIFERKDD